MYALALAAALLLVPASDIPYIQAPRTEKRIRALIRRAVSQKEADAGRAQETLIAIGLSAIPLLRQGLDEERDRSYTIMYIINRIYQKSAGAEREDLPARREVRRREGEKFLSAKFKEAQAEHEAGGHARARAILEAILTLGPDVDFRDQVADLLGRIKTSLYQATILSVVFETDRDAYEAGEIIEVRIRLRNPGKKPIQIPLRGEGVNVGEVSLERRIYTPDGKWDREYLRDGLRLPEEIHLEPGETYDLPYLIDTRGIEMPRGAYIGLWLSAKLRPPTVLQGEQNRARLIHVPRKEIPLLAAGQGALAEDPAGRLEANLEEDRKLGPEEVERRKEIAEEILPLAFLSARGGLWKTNRILIGALEGASPAAAEAAMTALSSLNGVRLTLEKPHWEIWWFKMQ